MAYNGEYESDQRTQKTKNHHAETSSIANMQYRNAARQIISTKPPVTKLSTVFYSSPNSINHCCCTDAIFLISLRAMQLEHASGSWHSSFSWHTHNYTYGQSRHSDCYFCVLSVTYLFVASSRDDSKSMGYRDTERTRKRKNESAAGELQWHTRIHHHDG